MRIRVLTYNIRHGRGSDDRLDLTRIVPVLRESGADIICLQEVDLRLARSGFADQAARLAGALGFRHRMAANFGLHPIAGMGNAILSRGRIYSTWNKTLPFAGEPRGLLYAEAGVREDVRIGVFCTHWGLSEGQRARQAAATARLLGECPLPCLLCGDLNARPESREIGLLLEEAGLQSAGSDGALTYPALRPEAKIDYVLASRHWQVIAAGVLETLASDHLPLLAGLELA